VVSLILHVAKAPVLHFGNSPYRHYFPRRIGRQSE
jgi:hypothetical protein